ncbi:NAD-dependent protein deacylase [Fructilactobacillus hinvesii]|uniref:protein acetyllysine N-acetyltransferase n=1 Tax=Fructilactobacillus hinvesii TaxID=2940300 RepID=A0ABY5BUD0_9LACO|nr:NAD-dependent protein deacylase [Fructilactobacillus hinvesii]USS87901.1 NAD-dependent protein deacylase [Fructilactobacillus hinvesii]
MENFAALQAQVDSAQHIVFLTGAGVSTPSGIPDYRSKSGLYTTGNTNRPTEYYLSHDCLVNEPAVFYQFVMKNLYYPDAQPNVIQKKQAAFTNANRAAIVTQNIDNLYEAAGASHLHEFHGNLYRIYCQKCGAVVDYQTYAQSMYHQQDGGILRPDVVLYGEGINPDVVEASVNAVMNADLILIVGTSMRVYPFAGLLDYRQPNVPVVVINQEHLDLPGANTQYQLDASEVFDRLQVNPNHD